MKGAILIAGPTASGKSALAIHIAQAVGGAIVNTDSMQVYALLDRLTARPSHADIAAVPHHLYGYVDPAVAFSTGHWLRDVGALADSGVLADQRPVFCGGTGLYFRGLLEGLSAMPAIPAELRAQWRSRLTEEGPEQLHRILAERDPGTAARLKPTDGQRILRALEVLEVSGRSILSWQAERGSPLVDKASASMIVLDPDRADLGERIEARFRHMMQHGAVEEVRALLARNLDPAMPAMRAIGVREIALLIDENASVTETLERVRIATRQYAKRQSTWFRNQFGPEWQKVTDPDAITRLDAADTAGFLAEF